MIGDQQNPGIYPIVFLPADVRLQQLKNCFRLGIPDLEEIIELYPGSLALIQGELPSNVSRAFLTQLTVSLLANNPDGDLVFIDGANIFPYYEISNEARKRRLNPLTILDRIQLSRAFNYHQITEILTNKLPELIEENSNIRTILVPLISTMHLSDEALKNLEYDKLTSTASILELTQAVGKLKSLTIQYDLIGLMTAESAPRSLKPLGGTYLAHAATDIIRVECSPISGKSSKDFTLTLKVQKGGPPIKVQLNQQENNNPQTILTEFW